MYMYHQARMDIMCYFWCLLALTLLNFCVSKSDRESVTVVSKDGTYVGYVFEFESLGQAIVTNRFLGIPYAEAPTGDLRFKKPKRKAKLTEPYDATEFGPTCHQLSINLGGDRKPGTSGAVKVSEDCLVLNIFAPVTESESRGLLPVMMFIHGGGFNIGSPTPYVSDIPSAYGDVVIVTVSYRLSLWGFLSTGDENLPGNYGLWDQKRAIDWVYDNIAAFGGDPDEITFFGHSAGGASTVYQAMYPGNKGKIKRAIAMSGSITCPWAFNSNPMKTAKRLARLVGCDTTVSSKYLASCLRSKTTEELETAVHTRANNFVEFPMQFVSVVDGDFVPESPYSLFHGSSEISQKYRNNLRNVDFMTGVTSAEGLMLLGSFVGVGNTETYGADRSKFEKELVPYITRTVFGENAPEVLNRLIIAEYTNWTDPDNGLNSLESYITASGDYVFNIQTIETALLHAEDTDRSTYVYLYDIFPSTRIAYTPSWNSKPQHGDEKTTFFGYNSKDGYTAYTTPYIEEPNEEWETEFTKAHIIMYTNFAKTGNPNEPVDVKPFVNSTWPKYDPLSQRYLHISRRMSEASVGSRLFGRATNFWWNVLPGTIEAVGHSRTAPDSKPSEYCVREDECQP